ncbi:MAG: hypothetical protein ACWA44_00520 [Thiotrichales bacterium]
MNERARATLKSASTLIEVVVLQIKNALLESEEGMEKISGHFTETGMTLDILENNPDIIKLRESNPEVDFAFNYCKDNIHNAIVSGQFYDRLHQRLEHAVISLNTLVARFGADTPKSTEEILEEIISCYSLEEEHEIIRGLFRSVMGDNVDYRYEKPKYKENNQDVEIF